MIINTGWLYDYLLQPVYVKIGLLLYKVLKSHLAKTLR